MSEVKINELNLPDVLKIWWGFFWRGIAIGVASTLTGAVLGAIFGFVVGFAVAISGGSQEVIASISKIGGGILGLIAGAYFFYIYLCWLLKSKFGDYRLAIIKVSSE